MCLFFQLHHVQLSCCKGSLSCIFLHRGVNTDLHFKAKVLEYTVQATDPGTTDHQGAVFYCTEEGIVFTEGCITGIEE